MTLPFGPELSLNVTYEKRGPKMLIQGFLPSDYQSAPILSVSDHECKFRYITVHVGVCSGNHAQIISQQFQSFQPFFEMVACTLSRTNVWFAIHIDISSVIKKVVD